MKKVLITGASGFIGSFLVEEGLRRDYQVHAGTRKTSSRRYLGDPAIQFTELDLGNEATLERQIAEAPQFDYVIHNAGLTKSVRSSDYFVINYEYTRNLIDALRRAGKVPSKFIYISSLAAYGPGQADQRHYVSAADTPRPLTSYGKSKLLSEGYLASLDDFPHVIIRPTAVYGPREKELLTVFRLINRNLELTVGSPLQQLTFVYIKDLVSAIFGAMESTVVNKAYFVSDGQVYGAGDLGRIIREELGRRTLRLRLPSPLVKAVALASETVRYLSGKPAMLTFEKMRELESVNWKCDIQPLRADINFTAAYDLQAGVRETIRWYRDNNWLR